MWFTIRHWLVFQMFLPADLKITKLMRRSDDIIYTVTCCSLFQLHNEFSTQFTFYAIFRTPAIAAVIYNG